MELNLLHIVIPCIKSNGYYDELISKKEAIKKSGGTALVVEGNTYAEAYNKALETVQDGYIWFVYPWMHLKENAYRDILRITADSKGLYMLSYEYKEWNVSLQHQLKEDILDRRAFAKQLLINNENTDYTALWNKIFSVKMIKENKLLFRTDMKEGYGTEFLYHYLNYCDSIKIKEDIYFQYVSVEQPKVEVLDRINSRHKLYETYRDYEKKCNPDVKDKEISQYYMDYLIYEYVRIHELPVNQRKAVKQRLKQEQDILKRKTIGDYLYIQQAVFRSKYSLKNIKRWLDAKKPEKQQKEQDKREQELEDYYKKVEHDYAESTQKHRQRSILLWCDSQTMFYHIWNFYEAVKDIKNYRYFIYYVNNWSETVKDGVELIQEEKDVLSRFWNLIVCPDARKPFDRIHPETKLLYINHGLHMISYDGGESLYAYSIGNSMTDEGLPIFDRMLEPNEEYVKLLEQDHPKLKGRIIHTGYKKNEELQQSVKNYSVYREKLGIKQDEKLIAVFGSWGKDSLFHQLGETFFEEAKLLMEEGYRFVLSIHPKEYTQYDENLTYMGPQVEEKQKEGFIIRRPQEDSIPFIVAADIVICDFTTLCEEAMLVGKPVILSPFPLDRVWKHSTIAKYMQKGPVLKDISKLRELLKNCDNDEVRNLCKEYAEKLILQDGDYKGIIRKTVQELLEEQNGETYS